MWLENQYGDLINLDNVKRIRKVRFSKDPKQTKDSKAGDDASHTKESSICAITIDNETLTIVDEKHFSQDKYRGGAESPLDLIKRSMGIISSLIGEYTIKRETIIPFREIDKRIVYGTVSAKANIASSPISALNLGARVDNRLKDVDIKTVGDLISKTEDDVKGLRGIGKLISIEIKNALSAQGLSFKRE